MFIQFIILQFSLCGLVALLFNWMANLCQEDTICTSIFLNNVGVCHWCQGEKEKNESNSGHPPVRGQERTQGQMLLLGTQHQIVNFFLRGAKIKHSRVYCLLISMCLLSLPKLKLPTNTFPTQCYESVQINMGSSKTMTPHEKYILIH